MRAWKDTFPTLKKAIMWGAGDQGRVNRAILEEQGIELIALVDDTPDLKSPIHKVPLILGKDFERWLATQTSRDFGFIIAIGNPYGHVRMKLAHRLKLLGLPSIQLVDHSAKIRSSAIIGEGIQIMPNALIHNDVIIRDQCIINTRALVEHDCVLNDGVEIGPGAVLCGRVNIGENSWIGAGAVIRPRIKIGKNTIIGAGAVVVNDIPDGVIAVGCPARLQEGRTTISANAEVSR